MPPPDGHRYLPSTAVFLVELLKLGVCLTITLYEVSLSIPRSMPATTLLQTLARAVFAGDSWKMAIPAGLYTISNSLQYVGISNLDAATFQVTYQLKILVTAVFSVLLLHRTLSARHWISLLLLMSGVAMVSLPHDESGSLAASHHARVYTARSVNPFRAHFGFAAADPQLSKRSATYEGIEGDMLALHGPGVDAYVGLLAVVGVCVCSGLAGVYFEKVIKDSPKVNSLWLRNVQMSLYSLFPAFFVGVVFLDGETVARYGFFAGYNWVVVLAVVIQAVGGIIAAFCIYYADNITKNFAASISVVLSALGSFVLFDFDASGNVRSEPLRAVPRYCANTYSVPSRYGRRPRRHLSLQRPPSTETTSPAGGENRSFRENGGWCADVAKRHVYSDSQDASANRRRDFHLETWFAEPEEEERRTIGVLHQAS